MTEKWTARRLGELCSFSGGGAFPKSEQGSKSGAIPFVKVSDLALASNARRVKVANNWVSGEQIQKMKSKLMPEGSVIFAKIGEGLKAERLSTLARPTAIDNNLMAAVPKQGQVNETFLYYLLSQVGLSDWAQGSALPFLRQTDLEKIPVVVPGIDEQNRIAEVLSALDDLIETNKSLAADLDEIRRLACQSLLNNAEESAPLSAMARFVNGKNFTKEASGFGRAVIRTPELRIGPNAGTVRNDVIVENDFLASAGDILFVWSGSLMMKRWLYEQGLVNQHIFKVVPNPDVPDWLVFAQLEYQMPWFIGLAADKATTMGHIQRGHLDEEVPLPSNVDVMEAGKAIQPIWQSQLELNLEILELEKTRDELLPLLLSGRVRVGFKAAA